MQSLPMGLREAIDPIGTSIPPMGLVYGDSLYLTPAKTTEEQLVVNRFKQLLSPPFSSRIISDVKNLPITSHVDHATVLSGIQIEYISGPTINGRLTTVFAIVDVSMAEIRSITKVMRRTERELIKPRLTDFSFSRQSIHNLQIGLNSAVRELNSVARTLKSDTFSATLTRYGDFVSSFSHEALSPIQQVRTTLDFILSGTSIASTDRERLEDSIESLDSLRVSLEGMRLLFRSDSKKAMENQFRVIDVHELVSRWCRIYRNHFSDKSIEVHIEPNGPWHLRCIPEYMEILVKNVINNGAKYSFDTSGKHNSGRFIVRYSPRDNAIRFINFGVPIPSEDIESRRVFEDGYRSLTASDRGRIGKGVGLHLVAKVASIHKARVDVKSEVQNPQATNVYARTEFAFHFPLGLMGGL